MKRRNAECGKLRRPLKRNKITEGIYGSTFLYLKFLLVWALVLMADFMLEFRFEYLWPFWLLLRSVYDSFKYQGLAFSVFFVCIAITSDVICYLFIPVQWLFFAASTYVWVQYVWHTDRGLCLPTISLWLLFVYIEASVRLREFKTLLPLHLCLCRPFAAHCIGYPVVTLGFGFKSYVSYRLRLRKQKDVQQQNDFYIQLLQKALPADQQTSDKQKALPTKCQEEEISSTGNGHISSKKLNKVDKLDTEKDLKKQSNATHIEDFIYTEQQQAPSLPKRQNNINSYEEENLVNEQNAKTFKQANGVAKHAKLNSQKDNVSTKKGKSNNATIYTNNKDDLITRMEGDIKRLKADLQSSRNCEQDLRYQINNLVIGDKNTKSELYQLRQDNESLQSKLHKLVTSRQHDKQNLSNLERKVQEERKLRTATELQLANERKAKKAEEAAAARAVAMATARGECTDSCKARRRDLDNQVKEVKREVKVREDQIRQLERETQTLIQYKDVQKETDLLMSALAAMKEKNNHLENSLSAETRLKLDLFSALGDAKRNMEILQEVLARKEAEIDDLKSKIAQVMALVPTTSNFTPVSCDTSPHFSATFTAKVDVLATSSLNPNATDYTPKVTQ